MDPRCARFGLSATREFLCDLPSQQSRLCGSSREKSGRSKVLSSERRESPVKNF
jgi:hypothetical protein